MCRILVFAVDQQPPLDNHWKKGDTVAVHEDGKEFGKAFDNNPSFRIVEFPGAPAAKYQYLTEAVWRTDLIDAIDNGKPIQVPVPVLVRRNKNSVDIAAVEIKAGSPPPGAKITNVAEADFPISEKVIPVIDPKAPAAPAAKVAARKVK